MRGKRLDRCDSEGVPKIVQRFTYSEMAHTAHLFTGQRIVVDLLPNQRPMEEATLRDIEQYIESFVYSRPKSLRHIPDNARIS